MLYRNFIAIPQLKIQTDTYHSLLFFANIFAHLHICPKYKLFPCIFSCSHYASSNSACFQNCSTSLTTHGSLGCNLSFTLTLSPLLYPSLRLRCSFYLIEVCLLSAFAQCALVSGYVFGLCESMLEATTQATHCPQLLHLWLSHSQSSPATVRFVWQLQNL